MDRRMEGRQGRWADRGTSTQGDGQMDREEDEGMDSWGEEKDNEMERRTKGWTDGQRGG